MPVETITKRTAGESLAVLRMGLRNVARSGRMKPDWARDTQSNEGLRLRAASLFQRHGYPFQSPLAGGITLPYLHLALIDFAIHFMLRRGVSQNILVSRTSRCHTLCP